jgi:hypothetical protein
MSETRNFLIQRQAALEAQMQEAIARACAPFEAELKEIRLAVAAMDRTVTVGAEPPQPRPAPAKPARGRRKRTLGEMVLMALRARNRAMDVAAIQMAMERRWNCAVVESRLSAELQRLQHMGLATAEGDLWRAAERAPLRLVADGQDAAKPRGLVLAS